MSGTVVRMPPHKANLLALHDWNVYGYAPACTAMPPLVALHLRDSQRFAPLCRDRFKLGSPTENDCQISMISA